MVRTPLIAAVLLLSIAACGGSPTAAPGPATGSGDAGSSADGSRFGPVLAAVKDLDGAERRAALLAMAKKERPIKLYTSLNEDVARDVLAAYKKATGLSVSLYRAGSENVRRRVLEETKAGYAGADVVETNGPEMVSMAEGNAFAPLDAPVEKTLVDGSSRPTWTATRFNIFAVAWNTDLVPAGQEPSSYQDLADPKWDGKMAMEIEDYDWYWALRNYLVGDGGMTDQEADAYFLEVAQGAAFTSGHTTMRQLLVAGEYALLTSDYSYGISEVAASGAPVTWREPKPIEPLFARPNGVGLVRTAPNPASAQLFAEWLLSDGQPVLADNNIDPTRKDLVMTGDTDVRIIDLEKYLAEEDALIKKYEELARAGKRVGK